jgi:hypothetical protein
MIRDTTRAKLGPPYREDRSLLQSRTMTFCLTPDLHKRLLRYSYNLHQPMGKTIRLMIEEGLHGRDENTVEQGE